MTTDLSRLLTPEECLGPIDADRLPGGDVFAALYDAGNRIHRDRQLRNAPFVIGRKGAGKTAFINAVPDGHRLVVRLPKADVYQSVLGLVEMLGTKRQVLVEHAERVWRCLVWSTVLWRMAHERIDVPGIDVVGRFVLGMGDDRVPADEEQMIGRLLARYERRIDESSRLTGIGDLLGSVTANGVTLTAAIAAADAGLAGLPHEQQPIVIMDSLERYPGNVADIVHDPTLRLVFEGLFRFLGASSAEDRVLDLRFAFPAELWPTLRRVSAAPVKDFSRKVVAHWSAKELVTMAGNRLALFVELQKPGALRSLGLTPRQRLGYVEAKRVFGLVLPPTVVNALGQEEGSLAYMLRHTQLLPRHFILLTNTILQEHYTRSGTFGSVAPPTVTAGVRAAEGTISDDVLSAYLPVHPAARTCCELIIKHLPLAFTSDELHRAYNRAGVRKATELDFAEVLRTLTEVGAIGRVVAESARYVTGEFEYTRPNELAVDTGEQLCLHPVFAETFESKLSSGRLAQLDATERTGVRPVYPYGADPDVTEDYRDVAPPAAVGPLAR